MAPGDPCDSTGGGPSPFPITLLEAVLDQLDEHALGAGGVQKSDQMSSGTRARDPIDELEALRFEARKFGFDVVGAVREVVESRTPTFEEATDGRFRAQWLEELDSADEGDADSLGL